MLKSGMSATQTVQEDPSLVIGKTLIRARKIVFDLPSAINGQMKAAREATQSSPHYKTLLNVRKVIRDHNATMFSAEAKDADLLVAVKGVRKFKPEAESLSQVVREASKTHRDRAEELRAEVKSEKEELAKDFASEVIVELLKPLGA